MNNEYRKHYEEFAASQYEILNDYIEECLYGEYLNKLANDHYNNEYDRYTYKLKYVSIGSQISIIARAHCLIGEYNKADSIIRKGMDISFGEKWLHYLYDNVNEIVNDNI